MLALALVEINAWTGWSNSNDADKGQGLGPGLGPEVALAPVLLLLLLLLSVKGKETMKDLPAPLMLRKKVLKNDIRWWCGVEVSISMAWQW